MNCQLKEIQNKPHFKVINTDLALAEICHIVQQKSVIALDTEFIRIRTLYPKLGLIQLYDGEQVYLIDPIVIQNFSPFVALLANQSVLKVLHASSEDLEVFLHYFQQLPIPMRDTQIMANFLNFPNSTGLATLIQHYFQLEIDKGASRTDWLARPLSEKQLIYAAADVWYLLPLYQRMQQELAKTVWQKAVEDDCNSLLIKREQSKDPELAYLSIANGWRLDSLQLMRLKLLAKWRQEEAMKRDLALNFVVRSEHLLQVAKYNPKHTSELLELGLTTQEVRIHGKKILHLLTQVKRIQPIEYPAPIVRIADDPRYKKTLKALQEKLKALSPRDLPIEVIASKRSLESLIKWYWLEEESVEKLPDLLIGWRREFGLALLATLKSNEKI
ncbi:ribonuclease D [Pasteurella canis]|uniref:Ribonuclease D n=1 Tax=Pasteurella canis TaxID=753 RepID=A0ABQ4VK73_9PAST|nr:ribonuclease D [Pasteurella canis]UEC24034.1 ribonuclease D [Pasteurella canis]GJH42692.1 ribonuclease D [Pasteurella canis]